MMTDDQFKQWFDWQKKQAPPAAAPAAAPVALPREKKLLPLSEDTGEAWRNWREHFESVQEMNGWTNKKARQELRSSMIKGANAKISGIPTEAQGDQVKPVKDLLDLYESRFTSMVDTLEAETEFLDALQAEEESILDWSTRLRGLYRRYQPKMPESQIEVSKELIQKFCRGINDKDILRVVVRSQPTTFLDALTLAQSDALARNTASSIFYGTKGHKISAVGRGASRGAPRGRGAAQGTSSDSRERACWGCNQPGHIQRECPNSNSDAPRNAGMRRGRGGGQRSRGNRGGRGGRGGRGAFRRHPYQQQQLRRLAALGYPEASEALGAIFEAEQLEADWPESAAAYDQEGQPEPAGNE